jgi:4-amino-4-deoxy-L-arabinose transferase-like glycosyltransferase
VTSAAGATPDPSEAALSPVDPEEPRPAGRPHRFAGLLLLLMLASLGWGTAYTLVTKGGDDVLIDEGDAFYYGLTAAQVAQGNGITEPFTGDPAAEHPPLTMFVLVPASLVSDDPLAQRLTMVVLGALTVGAVGLAGREVGGDAVGLAAAAVALVNPNLWINHALVMSETPFGLVFALLLWAAWRLARHPSTINAVLAGGLCGLAALTRVEALGYLVVMVVPILVLARGLPWGARLGRVAVGALALLAVIAPWTVWVNGRFVEPVLISTNGGLTLAGANCTTTYFGERIGLWSLDCGLPVMDPELDASQNSARLQEAAFDYIGDHLDRVPLVMLAREGRLLGIWGPTEVVAVGEGEGRPPWVSWAGLVAFWVLVPVSVVGAVALRRRSVTLVPVVATAALTLVATAAFNGIPRHRLGIDVVMCVLAGVAIAGWWSRRREPVGTS